MEEEQTKAVSLQNKTKVLSFLTHSLFHHTDKAHTEQQQAWKMSYEEQVQQKEVHDMDKTILSSKHTTQRRSTR